MKLHDHDCWCKSWHCHLIKSIAWDKEIVWQSTATCTGTARAWDLSPRSTTLDCMIWANIVTLCKPLLPHLQCEDCQNLCLTEWWRLNRIMHLESLGNCWVFEKIMHNLSTIIDCSHLGITAFHSFPSSHIMHIVVIIACIQFFGLLFQL